MKTTKEEFLRRLELSKTDYNVLDEFEGWDKKLSVKCRTCGHEDSIRPRTILDGGICPVCRAKRNTRTLDEFVSLIPEDVEIVSGYENVSSRVSCKCKKCGNEWGCYAYNLVAGHGCKKCGYKTVSKKKAIYDKESFDVKLAEITDEVVCVGEYTRIHKKALFECCKCGHQFRTTPHNILQGSRCPKCSISKGEVAVSKSLEENNISYIPQKKFDGLIGVGGRKLSYDFFLPDYNILIEYQGRGHYEPVNFANRERLTGEQQFEKQIEHDKRKRNYAKENGYELIEIPYQQMKNIPDIIKGIKEGGII